MSDIQNRARPQDKEMVPRWLVQAMFALMFASVALVTYDQLSGRPQEGVVAFSPITREVTLTLMPSGQGAYDVLDAAGTVVARSSDDKAGFIGVIGRVTERNRIVHDVTGNPPLRVAMRENGHVAIIDDSTGMVTELIGYGSDNVAAFAQFVD